MQRRPVLLRFCVLHLNRTRDELWIFVFALLAQAAVDFLLALCPAEDVAETSWYLGDGSGFRPVHAAMLRGLLGPCGGAVWSCAVVRVGVPVAEFEDALDEGVGQGEVGA